MASHDAVGGEILTGIVAAMEEEVAGVRARLVGAREAIAVGARITLGRIGPARVALAVTGDGERNARQGLAALLATRAVDRIIVVGVAGGLTPALEVGALVIASRVISEADGSVQGADSALVAVAAAACGARRGVVVSATRIADTPAEKGRLLAMAITKWGEAAQADAPAPPAVVDLESAAFAATATRARLPWIVLRAVSDTAWELIPALLNRSRDEGGAVRRARVARGLLTNPRALLPLLALRDRVRACAERLSAAVERTMTGFSADGALDAEQCATQRKERGTHGA